MEPTPSRKLRIAYLAHRPERDSTYWSGIPSRTARYLRERGHHVETFAFDKRPLKALLAPQDLFYRARRKIWLAERSPSFEWLLSLWMRTAPLKQFDVILCESSTLAACCPRNGPPVYVWTDAEIQSYVDTYWPDSRRARIANLDQAVDQEQRALDRMTNMLCASLWTMEEVSRRYRLSGPGHLVLAPFFDNLPHPPSREDAIAMANQRPEDVLRLLFIGVDWQRKGGPRVLDLVQAIRARGVNTELTIIGARPFESGDTPPGVRQLGFLDKTDPDQAKQFSELLQQSHFLILLSRAEAMGIALIEALAYAAPCIGANSGGIPTIVADGDNGILDPGGGIERLANQVLEVFGSKPAYLEMARHARASYDERFSRSVRLEQLETVLWAGRQERQAFSNAAAHD